MVRDGAADIVSRPRECGFEPRKVGQDDRESRCPAHRSLDHALSITRDEFNRVVLTCRSDQNRATRMTRNRGLFTGGGWEGTVYHLAGLSTSWGLFGCRAASNRAIVVLRSPREGQTMRRDGP